MCAGRRRSSNARFDGSARNASAKGGRRVFDVLSTYLTVEREDVSCASLATTLGFPQGSVKKLLYHMRQRYRWLLRDEVAQTVENPADIEHELRYLCGALAASAEQTR